MHTTGIQQKQLTKRTDASRQYLLQRPYEDANTDITFIDYLRDNRIELNTVLAAAGHPGTNYHKTYRLG
jgi:hypothetical protein